MKQLGVQFGNDGTMGTTNTNSLKMLLSKNETTWGALPQ
jgi:hypothetical protein